MKIKKQAQSVFFIGIRGYNGRMSYIKDMHADVVEQAVFNYIQESNTETYGNKLKVGDEMIVFTGSDEAVFAVAELDEDEDKEKSVGDQVADVLRDQLNETLDEAPEEPETGQLEAVADDA
jgi:hypothetical protein